MTYAQRDSILIINLRVNTLKFYEALSYFYILMFLFYFFYEGLPLVTRDNRYKWNQHLNDRKDNRSKRQ